jgi:hypothetical protein
MLKYLKNNFVLAALISVILVVFVYVERRNSDKKNNHKSIKDMVFWAKLFGASYALVLLVLLMKDKCPLSGGSCASKCVTSGGASGSVSASQPSSSRFSLSSLKNKFSSPKAPWSSPANNVSSATPQNVAPTVSATTSFSTPSAPSNVGTGSELKVIDLNNVNISDPDF